jgi:hypothetical protein
MIVRRNFEIIPVSHYSIDILDFIEVVFYDAPHPLSIRFSKKSSIKNMKKMRY